MPQSEIQNIDSSPNEAFAAVPDSKSNSMEQGITMRAKGLKLPSISVESMQIVALIAIITILAISMQINNDRFLSAANLKVMTVNFIPEAIMALGMTIVMISGGIDISIAGILLICGIVVGMLMNAGLPVPIAIVLTLCFAGFIGFINITMANLFKVHPFLSSLSLLLLLRGLSLVITGGATVSGFPDSFKFLGQETIFGIPTQIVLFAVLAITIGYLLKNHRFLQQAYFIGGNRRSARMSGIKVERFLIFAFVLNGILAGIAGIVTASKFGAASVSFGQNAELRVIAAVALGGASFTGGTGTILGTALGIFFLALIYYAFAMTGVNTYWQDVAIGAMLMIAVFLGEYLKKRQIAR